MLGVLVVYQPLAGSTTAAGVGSQLSNFTRKVEVVRTLDRGNATSCADRLNLFWFEQAKSFHWL